KYRGLENLEFALDIFINQRLYAANFQALNDPMEGRFIYSRGSLSQDELRMIRGSKSDYNILSLSESCQNMLMWSYYGAGHKGFVVGVEIDDESTETEPVNYVEDLKLNERDDGDIAKNILSKKLALWSHEREQRVFKRYDPFVAVNVKELIFGINTEQRHVDLLTQIAEKFCPGIVVRTINKSELELGRVDEYDI
ncbi:MAG: hypothetical protein AAF564_01975, partial [Bacteroidota bacterium]